MKRNDWVLIITVAAYSYLFYQQTAGINFLLFNFVLLSALLLKDKTRIKNATWMLAACGSLLSAIGISYYGNGLAVTANIISLSMLSALSFNSQTSVIASLLFSCYSYASSLVQMFMDWQSRVVKEQTPSHSKWKLVIIPLLITSLFFFMYRSSNALFDDFIDRLNIDFISWRWIVFTFGGLILCYGFFYHHPIEAIANWERNSGDEIDPLNTKTITLFGKEISISDEEFSGKMLFLLLNLLLLSVNLLDIRFLFIDHTLPKGVTYSQFVHQGTGMLIISILTAITIILFYFRGALNFSEKSKTIKLLACIWIVQNAFMIISTAFRNNMYVAEYGLTYKRIGVYIYLLLSLIGLITTAIKILNHKTNMYLFRINGWLFYSVLLLSVFINWDRFITDYNIHKAKQVQIDYVLQLSYSNLPQLFSIQEEEFEKDRSITYSFKEFERRRNAKRLYFLEHKEQLNWKSWYLECKKVDEELQALPSASMALTDPITNH